MKLKTLTERNYSYHEAGRIWVVPELRLVELPDGSIGISQAEITRIHRAIVNEICGSPEPLTAEEIEFLCATCAANYSEVASALGMHRSALTRWRSSSVPVRRATSSALKKWFWFRLFGPELGEGVIPLSAASNDASLLQLAHERALESHAVSEIHERRAAS